MMDKLRAKTLERLYQETFEPIVKEVMFEHFFEEGDEPFSVEEQVKIEFAEAQFGCFQLSTRVPIKQEDK